MNTLYLDEIEQNISKIERSIGFKGKYVVLFGANKPSEKMILFLGAKGIEVDAIIDNNLASAGKTMLGIKIDTPEEVLGEYRENAIILIASKYFFQMKKQLQDMGYQDKQIYQMVTYQKYSTDFEEFKKATDEIGQGMATYQELLKEYGRDNHVIMCPYNGIGDIYFIASYLEEYCSNYRVENCIVTVVSKSCYRVAKMFDIRQVALLEQRVSDNLMKFAAFIGQKKTRIKVLTHTSIHWDILVSFEMAKRMDWGTMFRYVLMQTNDAPKRLPVEKEDMGEKVEQYFLENHLIEGRTAIVSPYANTIIGLDDIFWKEIVKSLKKLGYQVYTNSIGPVEPALEGTKPLGFPLEIARQVVEKAGCFIGIRSGLCDVIESAHAKIFVLYPNSSMRFFNLKAMGFGEQIVEGDLEEEDILDKIVSGLSCI